MEALEIDCEAGPMAREVTEKEREEILRLVKEGRVTGKANATGVTGSTTAYVVRLRDGTTVSFERSGCLARLRTISFSEISGETPLI